MKGKRRRSSVTSREKKDLSGHEESSETTSENTETPGIKMARMAETGKTTGLAQPDHFSQLSLEIICKIFTYLPIRYVMRMDSMNNKMREAVTLHLRVRKTVDLAEHKLYGWTSAKMTDAALHTFLSRCRDLELIYGFHPPVVSKRRRRGSDLLSIQGIVEGLMLCKNLRGIELSSIQVLEAVVSFFPRIQILGTFKNRNGTFPVLVSNILSLPDNPYITSLHLSGIIIPSLNSLLHVRHLQLRWVQLTNSHPFKDFAAPSLQTFVMAHCAGPTNALKYVPLLANLAAARNLNRLEFIRVPYLGGLIHHIVQDGWQMGAFRQLRCVRFGVCKHALETDLGCLAITASHKLEEISVQPSLSRDSLFLALQLADVCFPAFERLHVGFVDSFPEPGTWTKTELHSLGLVEMTETPALITDVGMKAVGSCFPFMRQLEICNSPYIHNPNTWFTQGQSAWSRLTDLTLNCCHTLKLKEFCDFVSKLPALTSLQLENMFREPPKGCSRVGLSAGTGMGMTSSMILNQQLNMDGATNNDQQPGGENQGDNSHPSGDGTENGDAMAGGSGPGDAEMVGDTQGRGGGSGSTTACGTEECKSGNIPESTQSSQSTGSVVTHDSESTAAKESKKDEEMNKNDSRSQDAPSVCETNGNITDTDVKKEQTVSGSNYVGGAEIITENIKEPKIEADLEKFNTDDGINVCEKEPESNTGNTDGNFVDQKSIKSHTSSTSSIETVSTSTFVTNSELEEELSVQSASNSSGRLVTRSAIATSSVANAGLVVIEDNPLEISDISLSPLLCDELSNDKVDEFYSKSENDILENLNDRASCKSVNFLNYNGSQFVLDRSKKDIISQILPAAEIASISVPSESCSTFSGDVVCKNSTSMHTEDESRGKIQTVTDKNGENIGNNDHEKDTSSTEKEEKVALTIKLQSVGDTVEKSSSKQGQKGKKSGVKVKPITCTSIKYIEPARYSRFVGLFEDDSEEERSHTSSSSARPPRSPPVTRSRSLDLVSGSRTASDVRSRTQNSENHGRKGGVNHSRRKNEENQVKAAKCCNCTTPTGNGVPGGKSLYGKKKGLKRKNKSLSSVCNCDCHILRAKEESVKEKDSEISENGSEPKVKELRKCKSEDLDSRTQTARKNVLKEGDVKSVNKESLSTSDVSVNEDEGTPTTSRGKGRGKKIDSKPTCYIDYACEEPLPNEDPRGNAGLGSCSHGNLVGSRSQGTQVRPIDIPRTFIASDGQSPTLTGKLRRKSKGRRSYSGPKPNMVDKTTSTTDPIPEEDHKQVLHLSSKTLTSLSVTCVGITDILMEDCVELSKITGHACRVLKKVEIRNSTKLRLCNFTHCAKLDEEYLAMQVATQEPERNKVVYLRPMHKVDHLSLERALFSSKDVHHNLCVIYDYSKSPGDTLYNKTRVASWGDLMSRVNLELLNEGDFMERSSVDWRPKYPWGRHIYKMAGKCENGSKWELISDLPWLRTLSECPNVSPRLMSKSEAKEGVYSPGAKYHYCMQRLFDDLNEVIVECKVSGHRLHCSSCIFYINMCDTSGTPSYDPHFSGASKKPHLDSDAAIAL